MHGNNHRAPDRGHEEQSPTFGITAAVTSSSSSITGSPPAALSRPPCSPSSSFMGIALSVMALVRSSVEGTKTSFHAVYTYTSPSIRDLGEIGVIKDIHTYMHTFMHTYMHTYTHAFLPSRTSIREKGSLLHIA